VFEIDGASNRGINEIRELRENIKYMPGHSRFKIYIIDEVHMLTAEAFNALLKTLEEPPAHVLFLFATTEAHRIPITILSRCQRHNFKRIGLEDIVSSLERVCQELSFDIGEESLRLLAREAGGSMRDALSLLDQVMAYSEGEVTEDQVLDSLGTIDGKVIFDLSSALLAGNVLGTLNLLEELYNYGHDLKRLYGQMLDHFRHLLLVKMGQTAPPLVDVPAHEMTRMKQQVEAVSLESIHQVFAALFKGEAGIRLSAQPKPAFEALLIKLAQSKHLISFDEIVHKLDGLTKRLEERCGPSEQRKAHAGPKQEALGVSGGNELSNEGRACSDDLGETWQQLLSIFHQHCQSLVPSLEKAMLSKVDEDFLEIRVRGNSFYTARLRDKKSAAAIQKVCSQFFGRNMTINITEVQDKTSENNYPRESDKTRRLKKEALNHPMVIDTLDVFQGRVVDVKIL
jgi:DNA polymerase-3 subunit gamma/tau